MQTKLLHVRITPTALTAIKRVASGAHIPLGTWVRSVLFAAAKYRGK